MAFRIDSLFLSAWAGFALMRTMAHVLAFLWSRRLFLGRFGLPGRAGIPGVGVFALSVVGAVKARKFAKEGLGTNTAARDLGTMIVRMVKAWGVFHARSEGVRWWIRQPLVAVGSVSYLRFAVSSRPIDDTARA